ncbi:MAG: 2OG-Fe(II) oxygenase [Alphaproteobacteria bacterium]
MVERPFPHVVVRGFVRADAAPALEADYPPIDRPGSYPGTGVRCGASIRRLLEELDQPAVRAVCAEKFAVDLTGRPAMVTFRGWSAPTDGRIHTDSRTKLVTVLLYLNREWSEPGGRLRLLNSGDDLADAAVEVTPEFGTLVAFKVTENCWHGVTPFVGRRRSVQLNWVTANSVARRERVRHRVSAWFKALRPSPAGRTGSPP